MSSIDLIGQYGARIDAAATELLSNSESSMYGMLRYFMGYADEQLVPGDHMVGKRLRPGLLLFVADSYGALERALPAALAVELFHNFSLIHDDIEDNDELRRGRPTVWKLWGVNQAINAGDAQLILSLQALRKNSVLDESVCAEVEQILLSCFLEVAEGQHRDFALTDADLTDSTVTEEAYTEMITKKSAELIATSFKLGGRIAGSCPEDLDALHELGLNLGVAYQLHDDRQSIWGDLSETGKNAAGDILERKKTLALIHARDSLGPLDRERLIDLYADRSASVDEILALLERSAAQKYLQGKIDAYKGRSFEALARTKLPAERKEVVEQLISELIP